MDSQFSKKSVLDGEILMKLLFIHDRNLLIGFVFKCLYDTLLIGSVFQCLYDTLLIGSVFQCLYDTLLIDSVFQCLYDTLLIGSVFLQFTLPIWSQQAMVNFLHVTIHKGVLSAKKFFTVHRYFATRKLKIGYIKGCYLAISELEVIQSTI